MLTPTGRNAEISENPVGTNATLCPWPQQLILVEPKPHLVDDNVSVFKKCSIHFVYLVAVYVMGTNKHARVVFRVILERRRVCVYVFIYIYIIYLEPFRPPPPTPPPPHPPPLHLYASITPNKS